MPYFLRCTYYDDMSFGSDLQSAVAVVADGVTRHRVPVDQAEMRKYSRYSIQVRTHEAVCIVGCRPTKVHNCFNGQDAP